MKVLNSPLLDELAHQFQKMGWLVIPRALLFSSQDSAQTALKSLRDAIRQRPLVNDQPGCERYHLDESVFLDLLAPWLHGDPFQKLCRQVFHDEYVFVKYLRSRNPVHGQGDQSFHSDWYTDSPGERMEVFVALDDVTLENGPLEILTPDNSQPVTVTWEAGSMVVIDSVLPHRGTTNRDGSPRQVVSAHVGVHQREDEQPLAFIPQLARTT